MEFNRYRTAFDLKKSIDPNYKGKYDEYYNYVIRYMNSRGSRRAEVNQLILEQTWHEIGKPYYNVFPGVIKGFLNVKLDIPIDQLVFPEKAIAIRFAAGKEPFSFDHEGKTYNTKAFCAADLPEENEHGAHKIMFYLDIGEFLPYESDASVYSYIAMPVIKGMTIEEAIDALPIESTAYVGPMLPDEFRRNLVKILAAICLLGNDKDIKEFDVLNTDKEKYIETQNQKFIEKAKRRGKFGWLIGRKCEDETSPTYVNPHFQHYWIGKGRTKCVLLSKKGYFSQRDKIKQVPTGYEADEH